MKKIYLQSAVVAIALVLLAFTAGAQTAANQPTASSSSQSDMQQQPQAATGQQQGTQGSRRQIYQGQAMAGSYVPRLFSSKALVDMNIHNFQNQKLGDVNEVFITRNLDQLEFIIVSPASGVGGGLIPIPWQLFQFSPNGEVLLLNSTKEALQNAPRLQSNNWFALDDPQFDNQVHAFYNEHPLQGSQSSAQNTSSPYATGGPGQSSWGPSASSTPESGAAGAGSSAFGGSSQSAQSVRHELWTRRMSKIIGVNVHDPQNQKLGDINDVFIDVNQGALAYALISYGGFIGVGSKTAPVPWTAMAFNPQANYALLNANHAFLEQWAIDDSMYFLLAQPQYAMQLYSQFGQQPYWMKFGGAQQYAGGNWGQQSAQQMQQQQRQAQNR